MASVYTYLKPNARALSWLEQRRYELRKQIEALEQEHALMTDMAKLYAARNCKVCGGEGTVMRLIEGCECDGPRSHKCEACKGTGEPSSVSEKPKP